MHPQNPADYDGPGYPQPPFGVFGQPHAGVVPAPPAPGAAPTARKRRRWLPFAIVGGALLAGIAIGGAGQPAPDVRTVTVAGPERVVNHDVPGPTRTVTPASCRTALDLAEQIVTGPLVAALQAASDTITAVTTGDAASASRQLDVITKANGDMDRLVPRYKRAAASCRAGD